MIFNNQVQLGGANNLALRHIATAGGDSYDC